jgi:sucrose phosphorylase
VKQTGRDRTINRERLEVEAVVSELNDPNSLRAKVFSPYIHLIKTRREQEAFHPNASFEILGIDPRLFAIKRSSQNQTIYALTNISSTEVPLSLSSHGVPEQMEDLISGEKFKADTLALKPYQYVWLS